VLLVELLGADQVLLVEEERVGRLKMRGPVALPIA
jgi:hypothetical protein